MAYPDKRDLVVLRDHDWTDKRWILWVGACAPRFFLVHGYLDTAIEEVARWCHDHAPGLLVPEESVHEAYKEALAEAGLDEDSATDEERGDAYEKATADLTYCDPGLYIASWEWGIEAEDPTRAEVIAVRDRNAHLRGILVDSILRRE